MLSNDVIMTSSSIKNLLVCNYVDHGPISIPTKFQTNTPNNKEVTVRADSPPPPGQCSAKNSPAWIGLDWGRIGRNIVQQC